MSALPKKSDKKNQKDEPDPHLTSLITALEDIIFELDGNQVFKKVWVKDESILFMPSKNFLGKRVIDVMGHMAKETSHIINEVIHTGQSREMVYKHIDPSIDEWYRLRIKPVSLSEKLEDSVLVLSVQNVTAMKQNEIALIKATEEAERAMKSKSDFLSVMSHEIRTPLNGIIGITNLLKLNHTPEQSEYINNLLFSADHLMQLINNILDYTKIENDKLELMFTEVNLKELVENIINQFKSVAALRGLKLKRSIDKKIPPVVFADPIRLAQILNNLISNAIKFTDTGSVTVSIKLNQLEDNKAGIHFSIKDTGMGIPENLKQTIFESFIQGQQSTDRTQSGTGLGLAITQKLASLHNSQIILDSKPNLGSEFYFDILFDLPKPDRDQQDQDYSPKNAKYTKKTKTSGTSSSALAGIQILVVDDNPVNTLVASRQLQHFGAHTHCAESGQEALQLLKQIVFDAALIDLHMPNMDGYQLATIAREIRPEMHMIIFTADIMSDIKAKLAKINVVDILSKPFHPDKLLSVLLKTARLRSKKATNS